MFSLPSQTLNDWEHDLQTVIREGANQLSTYPLFSFPYSELGITENRKRVKRPKDQMVRSMLNMTHDYTLNNGYKQCAVWSWIHPSRKKFSSITRHHYVGFGPSAASMTGRHFYVNTFSVEEYAKALPDRLPVALSMPVDLRLEMGYWLYWRVYEMKIPICEFREIFGCELDDIYGWPIRWLERLGMLRLKNESYIITQDAAYWIHRLQNEYSLNYINRLWGRCKKEPWPKEVSL